MKRRSRQKNTIQLFALSTGLLLCLGGMTYAALQGYGKRVADQMGCFNGVDQSHTAVIVDASEPRWNEEQGRSLRRYIDQLYNRLSFNERLSIYTSEGDMMGSVLSPRFHICGQANSPQQLEAVNAEAGGTGYLRKQKQRLYDKVLAPELDTLLSLNPDDRRRQLQQSPMLEMIKTLSRDLRPGDRLVIVSDLINNSDTVQFCRQQNDLPLFSNFKKRSAYQRRLKPQSLEAIEVEVLMLQRHGYGQGDLQYCHEDELQQFWEEYFLDNGAEAPQFIRIRHGFVEAG